MSDHKKEQGKDENESKSRVVFLSQFTIKDIVLFAPVKRNFNFTVYL